jgi:hypothetical protein
LADQEARTAEAFVDGLGLEAAALLGRATGRPGYARERGHEDERTSTADVGG